MPDVIVTGLPKSGLTVASALLDGLPGSICFNSPPSHLQLASQAADAGTYANLLIDDFTRLRGRLLEKHPVSDFRAEDATPLVDELYDPRMPAGETTFSRPLIDDFILGAKHHTLYTSLLPALAASAHFKIIAVIRSPMEIFAAWQRLPQPLVTPLTARFWPEAFSVAHQSDQAACFVQLYDLYLQRYHELHDQLHIVKYEDILTDPLIISRLFGIQTRSSSVPLIQAYRPAPPLLTNAEPFRDAIRRYGVYTKIYYRDH